MAKKHSLSAGLGVFYNEMVNRTRFENRRSEDLVHPLIAFARAMLTKGYPQNCPCGRRKELWNSGALPIALSLVLINPCGCTLILREVQTHASQAQWY